MEEQAPAARVLSYPGIQGSARCLLSGCPASIYLVQPDWHPDMFRTNATVLLQCMTVERASEKAIDVEIHKFHNLFCTCLRFV